MTTFVLVPGAGGNASYWDELRPELAARGHESIAVELHQDDPTQGLREQADTVCEYLARRRDAILVAQSLGGFLAPMVAARAPLAALVLLNAMIPVPGETPGQWWGSTGSEPARRAADEAAGRDPDFDVERHFLHDVAPAARARMQPPRDASDALFAKPCEFETWPDIPIAVLAGREDRFFPLEFQRRIARERLGLEVVEIPGGHLAAVSRPAELATVLAGLAAG